MSNNVEHVPRCEFGTLFLADFSFFGTERALYIGYCQLQLVASCMNSAAKKALYVAIRAQKSIQVIRKSTSVCMAVQTKSYYGVIGSWGGLLSSSQFSRSLAPNQTDETLISKNIYTIAILYCERRVI